MAGYRRLNPKTQNKDFILFMVAVGLGVSLLILPPVYFLSSSSHPKSTTPMVNNNGTDDDSDDTHFPPVLDEANFTDAHNIWISDSTKLFHACSNSSRQFSRAIVSSHFLVVSTIGGLNRQRLGIADAVVAARILNATLIVPKLDYKSYFWKDSSNFDEIFNVDRFISSLAVDVHILKKLPPIKRRVVTPYQTLVPRECTPSCYNKRVLPLLMEKQVVHVSQFDSRLANALDDDLQKLRCRVNYEALRFASPILNMGRQLVKRMRTQSSRFIALDLRFDPNFIAFSGCYYGGGEKEKREMQEIRNQWRILHATTSNASPARKEQCPLTPEEVGLMLRALGFARDTYIYVGSGEVYGGDETLGLLKAIFPNVISKEAIARKGELTSFAGFPLQMAAIDFRVYDKSDLFVTNNNGYTAKVLAGRRRYFGHKRTLLPNSKILSSLFRNRLNMSWESFAAEVRNQLKDCMGDPYETRPGRGGFYENPAACICTTKDATVNSEKPEATSDDQSDDNQTAEMLSD